ncbi:GroES-like protein [Aspergillus heteromorphus CBS 117.55]|uniref:GroES-like protein n=1 Tax=Aspergillus heteromorphus CBS 117.55 TaxID=1448321 RepID=A0A317WRA8_9EURO|nr:GroES-like protein [Aspergillus heteromorphus CBS 117.55]PWY88251.1 GroES-like protein [Aspergillus heteromorphus CBS 117.55]
MTTPTHHLAAITPAKGAPFTLQTRITPKPGPDELLIAVKSVALNPADTIMRDEGLFIPDTQYPTVVGFDISGVVLEVGENVPIGPIAITTLTATPDKNPSPYFPPGTRIAAYSAFVWKSCSPDYGAFQERCLVPWQHAMPVPNHISWNEAATLPVAGAVALNAWDIMGIPRVGSAPDPAYPSSGSEKPSHKREALLIWGASSSVGSMGVQTARLLREDPASSFAAVYATAGAANQMYVAELGADRVFDYNAPGVVESIVNAAREDELVVRCCFLATGEVGGCQGVVRAFVGEGEGMGMGKIASAPRIPVDVKEVEGVEVIFLMPSMEEGERKAQFRYWLGTAMRGGLGSGAIRPSPGVRVVGRGLAALNEGLDLLQRGVSCVKLVVEVAE